MRERHWHARCTTTVRAEVCDVTPATIGGPCAKRARRYNHEDETENIAGAGGIVSHRVPRATMQRCHAVVADDEDLLENRIPVLLITAFGAEDVHTRAMRLDASAILDKPLPVEALLEEVRNLPSAGTSRDVSVC